MPKAEKGISQLKRDRFRTIFQNNIGASSKNCILVDGQMKSRAREKEDEYSENQHIPEKKAYHSL